MHSIYAQGPYIGSMDLVRIDFMLDKAGPQVQRDFARPCAILHDLTQSWRARFSGTNQPLRPSPCAPKVEKLSWFFT